jgi:hypothetical protein
MGIEAFLVASEYETEGVKFSDRYRGECLQQIIRKTFYDTLLIIENDFSLEKENRFIVFTQIKCLLRNSWRKIFPEIKHFYTRWLE